MHGEPPDDCLGFAQEVLDNNIRRYPEFFKELDQLKEILTRYHFHYQNDPWKILEVESRHNLLLDKSTVEYGLQLDLLVEVTSGRDKGQVQIVDHKYVYDFFTDREMQMNAQLNKYMLTLITNGQDVRKAILNQIRYRSFKNPRPTSMFRRDAIIPTYREMDNFMREYEKVASRIAMLDRLPIDDHLKATTMHIDKTTCGTCSFQPLCHLYLQGQDTYATEKALYQHNSYTDQYR